MKAVVCNAWGVPDSLVIEEHADLVAGNEQVVIAVKAAGVNFPDVLIIQNKYQFKPNLPFTPGSELSGVIAAVGDGVTHWKVGDHVIAFADHGAFAEQVVVPVANLMPMPPGMPFDVAAAITLTYGTSHHAVCDRAQLQAGETMLVLGAAGGVGLAAIDIGKALGARDCGGVERRQAGSVPSTRRRRHHQLQHAGSARGHQGGHGRQGTGCDF
jgi:NADPH2:quinone reductase